MSKSADEGNAQIKYKKMIKKDGKSFIEDLIDTFPAIKEEVSDEDSHTSGLSYSVYSKSN